MHDMQWEIIHKKRHPTVQLKRRVHMLEQKVTTHNHQDTQRGPRLEEGMEVVLPRKAAVTEEGQAAAAATTLHHDHPDHPITHTADSRRS
jgi:hypothetical protein